MLNKIMTMKLWKLSRQDLENWRVTPPGKLETTDRSRWLEDNERIYYDTDTGEVVIRNV